MNKTIWKSKYFCGNKISDYGIENGYIDYKTLASSFDAVLVNDIAKLNYCSIDREYSEFELVNGWDFTAYDINGNEVEPNSEEEYTREYTEIYQYYIISDMGANILKDYTEEIVYYIPFLDCYVWGVTHYGTSWDYVLTDIKIKLEG